MPSQKLPLFDGIIQRLQLRFVGKTLFIQIIDLRFVVVIFVLCIGKPRSCRRRKIQYFGVTTRR